MISYVFRSLPLKRDSRTIRYGKLITDGQVIFNTWEDSYSVSHGIEKLKIARNRVSKIISYPLYLFYLFIYSLLSIEKNSRVICMDLDTFIPVYLGSFWKSNLIYLDIVDPISQTKFSKIPFSKFFDYLEYFLLKYRHLNILPNNNRVEFYKDRFNLVGNGCQFLLIENVPEIFENPDIVSHSEFDIGYFGTLDSARGLEELIKFIELYNLKLLIGGMGGLDNYIMEKSQNNDLITFIGSYNPTDLNRLHSRIKFIWAYYSADIFLHKYASPNKYYEHLAFKKPMIINKFVPLSQKIKRHSTGIIIDDLLDENCFCFLNQQILTFDYTRADYSDWDNQYSDYSVDFHSYEKNS